MQEEGFYLVAPEFRIWSLNGIPFPFMGFCVGNSPTQDIYVRVAPLSQGEITVDPPVLPTASIFFRGRVGAVPETTFVGSTRGKISVVPLDAPEAVALSKIWQIPEACLRDAFSVLVRAVAGAPSMTWRQGYNVRRQWP